MEDQQAGWGPDGCKAVNEKEESEIEERGKSRKETTEEEKFGEAALTRFRRCCDGQCNRSEPHEMTCGCGVGCHVKCAGISRGAAASGVFECGECKLFGKIVDHMTEEQRLMAEMIAWEDSKGELASYAHGTYKGQEAVLKHINDFHEDTCIKTDPLYDVNTLALFLRWDTANRAGGRSKSVHTTVRTLAALMKASKPVRPNITKKLRSRSC